LGRILYCADFSENSRLALNYAISVAAEYNAELSLLHVLEEAPSPVKRKEAIAAAKDRLNQLVPGEEREAHTTKTVVRIGKPYEPSFNSPSKRKSTW
jgi:nucleotide-binding universal stress UspA family protein